MKSDSFSTGDIVANNITNEIVATNDIIINVDWNAREVARQAREHAMKAREHAMKALEAEWNATVEEAREAREDAETELEIEISNEAVRNWLSDVITPNFQIVSEFNAEFNCM